ncbi:Transcription initiation factor IIA, gamma subunit [Penicillium italicum]|uniref:Transcription initiation factor IIA subunit 2 n=1 Tax=Penicillium italicum TaxID=40296 RepID=A0A0A2L6A1_PENIT|nr:Transcription initiation factor IIA, gamma subunit [Penicillium italicum]
MASVAYYELYRGSSLGLSLTDTLDDLINEGRIEPQLAMKILGTFDKIVTEVLADKVRARLTFKGHLDTYRFCDEVWTFLIKDVSFKLDNQTTVSADKVKIVSCNSKRPGEVTLPWLRAENSNPVKKESTPRKRVKTEPSPDPNLTPKNPRVSPPRRDFFRSSQSPPTSPIRRCPSEEFLIEGIQHDDGWVMVEDEFYAVAQAFTQHLHHAEYLRRRRQVKAENAAGIREIERPTDSRTPLPNEVKLKREAEALRGRQKAGLAQIGHGGADEKDEAEDDERWAGTHLHDLMTSPRKTRSLAGVHAPKSSTRAAAGFGQAPTLGTGRARVDSIGSVTAPSRAPEVPCIELDEETTSGSDDDDDLDIETNPVVLPPPKKTNAALRKSQTQDQTTPQAQQKSTIRSTSTSKLNVKPARGRPSSANAYQSRVQSLFDDLDELPESSRINKTISNKSKEHPLRQSPVTGGGKVSDAKKSRHNEVPTFLM